MDGLPRVHGYRGTNHPREGSSELQHSLMPEFFGARVVQQSTLEFRVKGEEVEYLGEKVTSSEILEVWDDSGRQHYPGSSEYERVAQAIEG
jgi:hypothetical protein